MGEPRQLDLAELTVRQINGILHGELSGQPEDTIEILNASGQHNLAVGVFRPATIHIRGRCGYYAASLNEEADITIYGNVGRAAAENIMSGSVRVYGHAGNDVASCGNGGFVLVAGNAGAFAARQLKGADVLVAGNTGARAGFLAQAGTLVIGGNTGRQLGHRSVGGAFFVRGEVESLGEGVMQAELTEGDRLRVGLLLINARAKWDPKEFRKYVPKNPDQGPS